MLSKSSLWLVFLWFVNSMSQDVQTNCTVDDSELPEVQSGINNFVVDELGSILFPYALNQCTGSSVITTGRWYEYQCSMDNNGMSTVTKTEYFTDDCSDDGSVVAVYNETGMTEGEVGYFECSGTDSYARIRLSLDSDCENAVVIYAALGACTNMGENSQMNFYCSPTEAIAQVFTSQMMQTTFLPSSTQLLFNNTGLNNTLLPTGLNNTAFPTEFNATLPTLFNATNLPTGLNETLLPTGFNATLSTAFNGTFNATMPSMLNISTSQIEIMMCEDDAFCDKWIITKECNLITSIAFGLSQGVYGIFDECSTTGSGMSTTQLNETFNTTFGENITVTEPSTSNVVIITTMGGGHDNDSGAVRPSLIFVVGMFLSFFFLVSV